jgi:hypothetical protein
MTKRQIIDKIMGINRSAQPEFLARFSDEELSEYLEHLQVLSSPRLSGDPHRYDTYFENCPAVPCRPSGAAVTREGGPAGNNTSRKRSERTERPVMAGTDASQADDRNDQESSGSQQGSGSWLF